MICSVAFITSLLLLFVLKNNFNGKNYLPETGKGNNLVDNLIIKRQELYVPTEILVKAKVPLNFSNPKYNTLGNIESNPTNIIALDDLFKKVKVKDIKSIGNKKNEVFKITFDLYQNDQSEEEASNKKLYQECIAAFQKDNYFSQLDKDQKENSVYYKDEFIQNKRILQKCDKSLLRNLEAIDSVYSEL